MCAWYATMQSRAPLSQGPNEAGGRGSGEPHQRTRVRCLRVSWGAYAFTLRTSHAPWMSLSLQLTRSCST